MYVQFELKAPNFGYMWTEGSRAKIATADLLGKRILEVTKGTNGYPTFIFNPMMEINVSEVAQLPNKSRWVFGEEIFDSTGTNLLATPMKPLTNLTELLAAGYTNVLVLDKGSEEKAFTATWDERQGRYIKYDPKFNGYYLHEDESPAVTEQLQRMVTEVEQALPNILRLTNQLSVVLSNSAALTSNLNVVAIAANPAVSNLAKATQHLDQPGSLGEWLIPTNVNRQIEGTLSNAEAAVVAANTNSASVMNNLNRSLDNVANLTSNLNNQVQANSNILSSISSTVTHADEFVQGLKRFWLFKHLFKTNSNPAVQPAPARPVHSPKGLEQAK